MVDIRQWAGDVNGEGVVNAVDLTYLLSEFNRAPIIHMDADIDENGIVNAADLTYLLAGFNKRNVIVGGYAGKQVLQQPHFPLYQAALYLLHCTASAA